MYSLDIFDHFGLVAAGDNAEEPGESLDAWAHTELTEKETGLFRSLARAHTLDV